MIRYAANPPTLTKSGLTPVIQVLLLLLPLSSCHRTWHEASHMYTGYDIDQNVATDSTLEHYLTPYRQQLARTMNDTVAIVGHELTLQKPESSLGNFLTDLLVEEARGATGLQVDLAIQNYGGVRRTSLAAGPLRLGMIYEVMPFDNLVVVLKLDAAGLERLIEYMAAQGGWPVSASVRYQIQENRPQAVLIHNRPIEQDKTYLVAMSDYIANGGDRCDFLRDYPRIDTGLLMRDAIIQHCARRMQQGLLIDAVLDGRITLAE